MPHLIKDAEKEEQSIGKVEATRPALIGVLGSQ